MIVDADIARHLDVGSTPTGSMYSKRTLINKGFFSFRGSNLGLPFQKSTKKREQSRIFLLIFEQV